MSEANILNPSASDQLNPDYGYSEGLPELRSVFQAQSGNLYTRRNISRGRSFELGWLGRPQANIDALRQWERQYENDFFTYVDWARSRYYSGRFDSPLIYSQEGNDKWTVRGRFVELPGRPMNTYPSNWSRDAIYCDERDGFGNDLFKQTGTWTYAADANAHGGAHLTNANTNASDKAELIYFGYGARIFAKKANNLGILNWRVKRVRDGTDVYGPTAVDLYSAGTVAAAALDAVTNLGLDLYRVSIEATNTKNGSSAAKTIIADAIQVMQ